MRVIKPDVELITPLDGDTILKRRAIVQSCGQNR